jgi:hypothetical protein
MTMDNTDLVRSVIVSFAADKKSFTNMDIARKANETQYVRYAEVRNIVRDWAANDTADYDYTVSSIRVTLDDGSTATANLYHHEETDPNDYTPRDQSLTKKNDAPPAIVQNNDYQAVVRAPVPVASSGGGLAGSTPGIDIQSILNATKTPTDATVPKTADDLLSAALKSAQDIQNKFYSDK